MEDLRVRRTRAALENAFYKMRAEKPLEKIKIIDLCKEALVNKATFYNYYGDIYEFSDALENEVLKTGFDQFPSLELLFVAPEKFVDEVFKVFTQNDKLAILFDGRYDILIEKAEKFLIERFDISKDVKKKLYAHFFIRGAFGILLNYQCDEKLKLKYLIDIAQCLIKNIEN